MTREKRRHSGREYHGAEHGKEGIMRIRAGREIGRAIRRDWDSYKTGLLVAAGIAAGVSLLGHGLCPSRELLGLPCPGCGLTRSILMILRGRFAESWQLQPFGYAWLALAVVFVLDRYVLESRQKLWKGLLVLTCVGMVALYGYRMVTLFPHTEPMTYYEGNLLRRMGSSISFNK